MRRARTDGRTAGLGAVPLCHCAAGGGGGLSMISTRTKERVRKSMQGAVESEQGERAGNGEADADGEAKRSAGGRTAGVGVSGTHLGRLWDAFVREGRSRDVGREPLQREGSMKERKKEVRKERQK